MNEPIYENGLPQNLEAAALDALDWMRWMRDNMHLTPINRVRLKRAIAALELFLLKLDPQQDESPATGSPADAEGMPLFTAAG